MVEPVETDRFRYEPEDTSRWHAVQINNGADQVANSALQARGYETLFLHFRDKVRHARRVRDVIRPYFPGYLFARIGPLQPMYPIGFCHGVSGVVCAGTRPVSVPLEVIEELQQRGDPAGLLDLPPEERTARRRFRSGDDVRIVGGPLAGLLAVVGLDSGSNVRVWVALFHGRVRANLDPDLVSPILRSRG